MSAASLKQRTLGRTGWPVSEIGFGAWGIGKRWWGTTSDEESVRALRAAWEAGITFYDTAYVYGDGHSESLIGQTLASTGAVVATKIPPKNMAWPASPESAANDAFPADWIVSCTERSLRQLKRETIDLTQFHVWTDAWLGADDWKEAVAQLKKQGKIRAFGVSINDHDPDSAMRLVASGLVDTVQVIFNIFDQSPAEALFPLCRDKNVGVIVRVPLDEGGLSGTLTKKTKFEKGDFRSQYFGGRNLEETVDRVEKLKLLLDKETPTLPDLALKFVLAHEAVSVVIPGMRTVDHVRRNAAVPSQAPLRPAVINALRAHAWRRNFYDQWDD